MPARTVKIATGVLVLAVIAAGLFTLGRVSAGTGSARDSGYRQGHVDGYFAGLRDGTAAGRQEGRSAQEVDALPANARQPAKDSFNAGYAAGANDVFAGYDGGWGLDAPYLITVEHGHGKITYRIATRTELQPGVAYYLCADGHSLCQQPR